MSRLGVIVASTREGRVGEKVADWFVAHARRHGGFDVHVLDLKAIELPLLSEPHHPRLQRYTQDTTRAWSRLVSETDAFAIVTPEYNFSAPPALVNAIDHLYHEWAYKAAGFVSYGGVSGGLRSVQMIKQLITALKIVPVVDAVTIPFVAQSIDVSTGAFTATDSHGKAATAMLDELGRWTTALSTLRPSNQS
jgi:NAD(P)H-dependent FMN reductase